MKSVDINLLIDVGVGKKVENYLDEQGFSVKAIRYIDPSMTDSNIIKLAFKEERVIITMDYDFGELVYHSSMDHSGIILLRLEDATGQEKLNIMKEILAKYSDKLIDHFSVYQRGKFRIRKIKK